MAKKDYGALVANVMQQTVANNVSTPAVTKPEPKLVEQPVVKPASKKDKVFTAIIDEELLEKMRYIAKSNNLSFKAVIEASFKKSISSFEEKNGTIVVAKKESGRAEDLF
ncbi:MAG: hypothetical protein MJZ19_09155 [Paludibacteraceae bacterium]|nr:hypothetical protein [Paludibacteraceae bacterium]